ncbi:wall-associated receptor kinase, galacturonan-binding domain-containing protein [Artemisia annua]|uniref:Wall-associated receptor kinase, galacturonan-binding domain-containing protein n=1 Tax=Artemisia annua TaxID=35608 RepID=A0A2U1LE09_ARTAN|nr:wall-associated receptor kinase, galacturonan-binding domain-containing protein [Artemisia annua]
MAEGMSTLGMTDGKAELPDWWDLSHKPRFFTHCGHFYAQRSEPAAAELALLGASRYITCKPTSPSLVPRYTKPGCTQMCGNISIPYPFGIEPNCYLNKWYAVNCTSSKPYLSSLKNLPLLRIDLYEQMVLVNVRRSSDCQSPGSNSSRVMNVDLGDTNTPFLFSKSHNKFIVEGCGKATISSGGNVLMECTTTCSQQSLTARVKNCETHILYYLKTYSVNLTSSGTQTGYNSCLSAFLAAGESYIGQSVDMNTSLVPVVLRWTLPNDFSEASCGYNFTRHELHTNDSSSVNTAKCSCWSELDEGNPYISGGCQGIFASPFSSSFGLSFMHA